MRLFLSAMPFILAASMCGGGEPAEPAAKAVEAPAVDPNPMKQIPKEYNEAVEAGVKSREDALKRSGAE
jgi:hypothetical protein